ncbi:unnamed protein product [Symbiodinium sp. CCMP2592]|nr:unnamed protein product [Symbiodinium sp. CCMP2592]
MNERHSHRGMVEARVSALRRLAAQDVVPAVQDAVLRSNTGAEVTLQREVLGLEWLGIKQPFRLRLQAGVPLRGMATTRRPRLRHLAWACLVLGGVPFDARSFASVASRRGALALLGIGTPLFPAGSGRAAAAEGMDEGPTEADVSLMQSALSSVRKLGDFPSKAALGQAEAELTELLRRWRRLPVAPNEVPALLRRRAFVRLRAQRPQEAQADLVEALQLCEASKANPLVQFDEMPKVLVARGNVLRALEQWDSAVADYDRAADLFGEPLEDLELLEGRAKAKVGQQQPLAAAEDFEAAAALLRSAGRRPEAEIQAEKAAVALLAAQELAKAEVCFVDVIRRCVGLLSKDVGLLQRVVQADSDARMAMVAISWHKGDIEVAETYWRDGCDRLNILADEASKNLALGFADGDVYNCTRYSSDGEWIRRVQGWPSEAIGWFQDFLQNRPGNAPPEGYLQDLSSGKRPGEGSTLMDLALASDAFRRTDPVADLQRNLQRQPELDRQRQTAEFQR